MPELRGRGEGGRDWGWGEGCGRWVEQPARLWPVFTLGEEMVALDVGDITSAMAV